jgi:hypothetical protein
VKLGVSKEIKLRPRDQPETEPFLKVTQTREQSSFQTSNDVSNQQKTFQASKQHFKPAMTFQTSHDVSNQQPTFQTNIGIKM